MMALASCGAGPARWTKPVNDSSAYVRTISWTRCTGLDYAPSNLECGKLKVPLDYRSGTTRDITISLVRIPAEGNAAGSVLTNPGGPGGSGIEYIAYEGMSLRSDLGLEEWDIIGFDPRGVGKSDPLECFSNSELDELNVLDNTPDTPQEESLHRKWESIDDMCVEKYGDELQNYSTEYAARDMDLIRESLGDEKLTFVGISYGTHLGAAYATLFPENVRAMVLDGAVDREGDSEEQSILTQANGFEEQFTKWTNWCEDKPDKCQFSVGDVRSRWMDLYTRLDKTSLMADGRVVNHRTLMTATKSALYSTSVWSHLGETLESLRNGDGQGVLNMADYWNGRTAEGAYSNERSARGTINCASGLAIPAISEPQKVFTMMRKQAPWYSLGWELDDLKDSGCGPEYGDGEPVAVTYNGAGPVVVVGASGDPATPIRWSKELAARLGDKAVFVQVNGDGHSQLSESRCVQKVAADLLIRLAQPTAGKQCDPDKPVAEPYWWARDVSPMLDVGTPIDVSDVRTYIGLDDREAFLEAASFETPVSRLSQAITVVLTARGYSLYTEDEHPGDWRYSKWFVSNDGKVVGFTIRDSDKLAETGASGPDGFVEKGRSLVLAFYMPD